MQVEIIPATAAHARALVGVLRDADKAEVTAAGVRPGRAVMCSWRHAVVRRAALVDGELAAVWGVNGGILSRIGTPWLLTGRACDRVSPVRFARIYRDEVVSMLKLFPILENYVDARYSGAVRLLNIAGFHLDDAKPYGSFGAMFRRFEMRSA